MREQLQYYINYI